MYVINFFCIVSGQNYYIIHKTVREVASLVTKRISPSPRSAIFYFAAFPLAFGEVALLMWCSGIQLSSNFCPSTPVAMPTGDSARTAGLTATVRGPRFLLGLTVSSQ